MKTCIRVQHIYVELVALCLVFCLRR